jgi:hypothetical protein
MTPRSFLRAIGDIPRLLPEREGDTNGRRTLGRCSFDARVRGSTRLPCEERNERGRREGFRNIHTSMRAVKDSLATPSWESEESLSPLWMPAVRINPRPVC